MGKRKETEKFIIELLKDIGVSDKNIELYNNFFKSMNDKEFDEWMKKLDKEETCLQVIVPPDSKHKISVSKNLKLAKKYGFSFSQHLHIGPTKDTPKIKTPIKFVVVDAPFRRLRQTIDKGVTAGNNIRNIDILTGQVVNDSQASKITLPEIQLMVGLNANNILTEFLKFRGGDVAGLRAMNEHLMLYGNASMNVLKAYAEGTVSNKTLKAYFNAIHLKTNKDK